MLTNHTDHLNAYWGSRLVVTNPLVQHQGPCWFRVSREGNRLSVLPHSDYAANGQTVVEIEPQETSTFNRP